MDTLRADRVPWAGYRRDVAPTLTRLAANGATFTTSRAQSPQTDGTHGALFSGHYPSTTGKFHDRNALAPDVTTLAETFHAAGYRTWGTASSVKFAVKSGLDQGFEDWQVHDDGQMSQRGDAVLVDALRQIADRPADPWFGFVHLFDVHAPYTAPEPYRSQFHPSPPAIPPDDTVFYIRDHRDGHDHEPAVLATLSDLYDAGIRHLDSRVEAIEAALLVEERDTIVVFFSDHGEGFAEHGRLGHSRYLWDELMAVPVVVWAPGRVPAGVTVDMPTQTVDLFPTILELADLPVPPAGPGISLAGALAGQLPPSPQGRQLILQSVHWWGVVDYGPDGVWKLAANVDLEVREAMAAGTQDRLGMRRLFELSTDPGETMNLAVLRPDIVHRLEAVLMEFGAKGVVSPRAPTASLSVADREALRALGYVD